MNCIKALQSGIFSFRSLPIVNLPSKRFRRKFPCDVCCHTPYKKPCFDINSVTIERATDNHGRLIKSFLYNHYWPREPSVVGLWMSLDCPYLEIITDRYSFSGDRFLAFELIKRTNERNLAGVCVANMTFPWMIGELEDWAHFTASQPERNRMYFIAHCLKSPNLFAKYNVDYLYDVEILGTSDEVAGQGVGRLLLQTVLKHANDLRHAVVQVIAVNQYTARICEKCGMKREWSMDYSEFVDDAGQRVFFPRRPHHTVAVYVKHFEPSLGGRLPCKPPYLK
ncbi:uncharacterized protein LOC116766557 [Danaus plexippus]|uniref:uncharacterized protein LOC116766557 n=1 Tax=Danaus plexippus TaxID=13037 RepID=UPI002AB247C9|nr:uncharacterized protein LOC116766557 [Danaus plexippus]